MLSSCTWSQTEISEYKKQAKVDDSDNNVAVAM